jgi:hypothetical protein
MSNTMSVIFGGFFPTGRYHLQLRTKSRDFFPSEEKNKWQAVGTIFANLISGGIKKCGQKKAAEV